LFINVFFSLKKRKLRIDKNNPKELLVESKAQENNKRSQRNAFTKQWVLELNFYNTITWIKKKKYYAQTNSMIVSMYVEGFLPCVLSSFNDYNKWLINVSYFVKKKKLEVGLVMVND